LIDLEFGGGLPDFKALADLIARRANVRGSHNTPNMPDLGEKSSGNGKTLLP
jgi:hypothetical protein